MNDMRKMGVGVIGCGVISKAYMTAMQRFSTIELKAVADMRSAAAEEGGGGVRRTGNACRRNAEA